MVSEIEQAFDFKDSELSRYDFDSMSMSLNLK